MDLVSQQPANPFSLCSGDRLSLILWRDLIATSPALNASRDLCLENDSMLFACDEYIFVDTYEMIKYTGA